MAEMDPKIAMNWKSERFRKYMEPPQSLHQQTMKNDQKR
jgi:hypothetical protein